MNLYALRDKKAGVFGPIMLGQNDAHMCRLLDESLAQANPTAVKYAEDFELWQIGEYDQVEGRVSNGVARSVCGLRVIFPEKVNNA